MLGSYENFKQTIYDITGVDLGSYKERQMKRRIDAMITNQKISSYTEYIIKMKSDRTALEEFCSYITINVSEFFRNFDQWKFMESEMLPELISTFGKNLKIWSAACSTGDEPYSMVLLLSKFVPFNKIKILATDVDKRALEKAAAGIYHIKSLKGLPKEYLKQYFIKVSDNTYQILDEIKSCVEFRKHDLLTDIYPSDCDLMF
jgi:chemotaxis protein methyltransferase CheR